MRAPTAIPRAVRTPIACAATARPASTSTATPFHCGGCGKVCGNREVCATGQCVCRGGGRDAMWVGFALLLDGCRDVMKDTANCGGCNRACVSGEMCEGGTCKWASRAVLSLGQICCGSGCSKPQRRSEELRQVRQRVRGRQGLQGRPVRGRMRCALRRGRGLLRWRLRQHPQQPQALRWLRSRDCAKISPFPVPAFARWASAGTFAWTVACRR